MKLKLILLLILFGINAFSQGQAPAFTLPNYSPKSPEAATFLQYGEYPVNLSTGATNISIPIYEIAVNGYKLPITLDYHASGIKVSQEASWVGLGWNLNFGATIVLNVKEDVDENNSQIDNMPNLNTIMSYYQDHPYQVNGGLIATQELDKPRVKDTYFFSSPTASGEFYIKNASTNPSEIVVYPPDAFKVEAISGALDVPSGGRSRFKITDSSGNVYIFRTTERTKYQNYGQMYNQGEFSSIWYVDEIRTSTNNIINFAYEDDGITDEYVTSQKLDVKETGENCNCGFPDEVHNQLIMPLTTMGNHSYTYIKRIKEIAFNNGTSKVVFNRLNNREDFKSGYNSNLAKNYCTSYLKTIEIRQKNGQGTFQFVRGFDLTHDYFNSNSSTNNYNEKRLKLIGVKDMMTDEGHSFTYSDTPLPPKDSFSKDLYGYFNGANNGNLIIPYTILDPYTVTVGSANRNVNGNFAKAGMLTEVHYPTKGWTKFNYESNRVFGTSAVPTSKTVSLSTGQYHPDFNYEPNPDYDALTFFENFTVNTGTTGNLFWEARNNAGSQYHQLMFHPVQYVKLIIHRIETNGSYTQVYDSGNKNGGPSSSSTTEGIQSYTGQLSLPVGNYRMTLLCYGRNVKMYGELTFTHSTTVNDNYLTGGLRIASIENYDHTGTLETKKEFSYVMPNDNSKSSGFRVNAAPLTFLSDLVKTYTGGTCPGSANPNSLPIPSLNYSITRSIMSNSKGGEEGNSTSYEYVYEKTINVNDQSSNGFTLYKFSVGNDYNIDPTLTFGASWLRGKVLEKSYFKSGTGGTQIVKKEVNTYFEDNSKIVNYVGFKMRRLATIDQVYENPNPMTPPAQLALTDCGGIPSGVSEMITFNQINISIPWRYLKSSQITETTYHSSNAEYGTMVTTKDYYYNNPSHLQLSGETITSSTGELLETKYFYPGDAEVSSEPIVGSLISRNIIAAPLKKQMFRNGQKLNEQKWVYKNWGNNLLMPELLQLSKGDVTSSPTPETRIRFKKIDPYNGNVLQVQQENGMVISYIYGYSKTLLIAKIENKEYDSIDTGDSTIILNLQGLSDIDFDETSEQNLRDQLNNFRNSAAMSNAMVTTYTYDPQVGITSITDPKGETIFYQYDSQGRLEFVKDKEKRILTANQYHYKP